MPRQIGNVKPLIYVFWEGESEQAYTRFLKKEFRSVAEIKCAPKRGLFEYAKGSFRKNPSYKNNIEVIDEIWFFFDVEDNDIDKWDARWKDLKHLQKLRKKPNIKIRLLMTTACVEYWFLLHFQMAAPSLHTVSDKEHMLKELQKYVPAYKKGDETSIEKIASQYQTAVQNGARTLEQLSQDGLPSSEHPEARYRWLCQCSKTFTNVHEAIEFLEYCKENR